jgi:hypothetical protein
MKNLLHKCKKRLLKYANLKQTTFISTALLGMILSIMPHNDLIAQKLLQGTVVDLETGEGFPGANVVVKGEARGTITDFDGSFELNVTDDKTILVVSTLDLIVKK